MIARALLDTNVLVHAAYRGSPLHIASAGLVREGLEKDGRYCIAPQNLVEFASVVTRSPLIRPPMSVEDASRMANLLYRSRRLAKIYPKRATVMRAIREGEALGVTGPQWYDLFLAITMRDAGVRLIITENTSDFASFSFITVRSIRDASA